MWDSSSITSTITLPPCYGGLQFGKLLYLVYHYVFMLVKRGVSPLPKRSTIFRNGCSARSVVMPVAQHVSTGTLAEKGTEDDANKSLIDAGCLQFGRGRQCFYGGG